jgi:hypothetical protein
MRRLLWLWQNAMVLKLELEDRTIIDYWFKEPDKLISNQVDVMVKESQLEGLKRVDFCVGGDHGGGKFRRSLKVLLQFEGKETISHLHQIASVSHSANDSRILTKTVLTPIGASLKRIIEGGRFFVQRDKAEDKLVDHFNVMVSYNSLMVFLPFLFVINLRFFPRLEGAPITRM